VPTLVSDIARATDPLERRTESIPDRLKSRLPGLRQSLEPDITVLGQERESVGNPLEILADPSRPSPESKDAVVKELRRLWDAGYKVSPSLLGDKRGYSVLTPDENTALWKRAGLLIYNTVNTLLKDPGYQGLADDVKADIVETIVDESQKVAKAEAVNREIAGLSGKKLVAKIQELKKEGLATNDIIPITKADQKAIDRLLAE